MTPLNAAPAELLKIWMTRYAIRKRVKLGATAITSRPRMFPLVPTTMIGRRRPNRVVSRSE